MIVTSLCYILFLFIYNYHKPFYAWRVIHDDLLLFIWGIILGSICVIIINLSFKISLHASSLTGLTINFLLLYTLQKDQLFLVLFLAFIPLTAIIIYQRLAGNFHTRQQVIAGVGLSCVIASITIGYYFLRMQ
ncbi:MAG: phosphatase PAP2 family protein [Bacteroidetes bacterium]|nr:phosphatase PAP2 family protein [Bacteroidota bacterium]